MNVLGIETSCDETAAAVVAASGEVLSSRVASQLELHAPYGGIVPEIASRQHLRDLPRTVSEVLRRAGMGWHDIQGVAATCGPGLMGALLTGLSWAKAAAWARALPFIGVNHLEGHLAAVELNQAALPRPFVGLVASGGHTSLYLVAAGQPARYSLLASTRDDAVGEAFDKVAKLLGLSYPGGPAIERIAGNKEPDKIKFSRPRMKDGSLAFSYSGLKTAVRYLVEKARQRGEEIDSSEVAAAFQQAVIRDLIHKSLKAVKQHGARALALTGGVAANRLLRKTLATEAAKINLPFYCPPIEWCTDNAAMIALAGARRLSLGERSDWNLPAVPNLQL